MTPAEVRPNMQQLAKREWRRPGLRKLPIKATAASDGAYMIGAAYAYDLSKRTSIGISYAMVKNDAGAVYNLYGGGGGYASTGAAPLPGEDPRVWSLAIRHAF